MSNYHNDLIKYIRANNPRNAARVVMTELGNLLAKNKADFIEVLRASNINVPDNATDLQLVNAFVSNIHSNRKLMLGTSFLINHNNKMIGFDGDNVVSDAGVKATFKVMYNFFGSKAYEDTSNNVVDDFYAADGYSYVGADPVTAIAGAVGSLADVTGSFARGAQQKRDIKDRRKYGMSDLAASQQAARGQLLQSLVANKQAQADAIAKQKADKEKKTRLTLIIGGSLLGLVLLGGVIYAIKKR